MLKKIGFAVVGLSLLASPLLASASTLSDLQAQLQVLLAQIAQLQQQQQASSSVSFTQPQSPAMPSRVCPQILRSLAPGSSGDDVMSLQTYLGVSPTGFFGPMTAHAVAQFQGDEGLSQVGIVGPQTRSAFARRCGGGGGRGNSVFSATPTYGAAPLTVYFRSTKGGTISFGDGSTGTMNPAPTAFTAPSSFSGTASGVYNGSGVSGVMSQASPVCFGCNSTYTASHTYASAGIYTATLTGGTQGIICNQITYDPSDPSSFQNLGDQKSGCVQTATQTTFLGSVTITVTNGAVGNGAPSISGVDGPTQLAVGQSGSWRVHVNDASGYLSYAVNWGDEVQKPSYGTTLVSASVASSGTFTHTYATAGTYSPTFTVTNGSGQSATASATVQVGGTTNQTFSASPTSGTAPLTVTFSNWNTGGPWPASTYPRIDFGDGSATESAGKCNDPADSCVSSGINVHTYGSAGTYTATLYSPPAMPTTCPLSNPTCGRRVIGTVTITVTDGQTGTALSATPTSGTAPLAVSFSGTGVTSGSQYVIEYGDGQNSGPLNGTNCTYTNYINSCSSLTASHTYATPGTYTAMLTPYYACLYTTPRCMVPAAVLGSAIITVYGLD